MLLNLKSLVVVLVLASIVFVLARPMCLRFMSPGDFDRRRKLWYILTIAAFVTPSFWLYFLVAAPLMVWAGKKDATPASLYLLLLFAVPPVSIEIPTIGIGRLFDLSQARLLGLTVLLPAAVANFKSREAGRGVRFTLPDALLLLYGALQVGLLLPFDATTNTGRRAFFFLLDEFLIYLVFSRMGHRKAAMVDTLATLVLATAVMAPMAAFESIRQWLLYTGIGEVWGSPNSYAWLLRGDSLRAQVSTGHSLPLGYMMAMAIGCLLYLKSEFASRWAVLGLTGLLSIALYFSYARAPWLTAVIAAVLFYALGTPSTLKFLSWALVWGAVAAAFLASPLGSGIADKLPIIGSVGQETVEYRQQLAETSWRLIQQNPWLGNPLVLMDMEELRQGEGIIDLVNAYATVTLFYGVIGLTLFSGVFVVVIFRALRRFARARGEEPDTVLLGASLLACMIATLLFMATAGFAWMQWQFAGLLASYAMLRAPQFSAQGDWAGGSLEPFRATAA